MRELRKSTPVARKEHRCLWCGGVIAVGEKYERATLIYDGDVYDWVNHLDCRKVTSLLSMFENCDDNGLGNESFEEQLTDYVSWMYGEKADEILAGKDLHAVVQRVIADWDTPAVRRKRLQAELSECRARLEHYSKMYQGGDSHMRYKRRVEKLEAELAGLS